MRPLIKSPTTNLSWQSDYRNALKNFREIKSFFNLDYDFKSHYTAFIPIAFAEKIKAAGEGSALWQQFIPVTEELNEKGKLDPIGDIDFSMSGGIIHRYNNRLLYTPTTNCPVICRYCFRKNELSENNDIFKTNLSKLAAYLKEHPEVNEVILTGGDPLVISNKKLDDIFHVLSELNISFVRIHTRTPIIIPSRIDTGLIEVFKKYQVHFQRINFVLHTNHTDEIDQEVEDALNRLRETSIKKLTQSVLLKGINDSSEALQELINKIISVDFTPYYLHHPDQARGAMHFHMPLEEGRKVYAKLRKNLSGWALPSYVIDQTEGAGKQFAFNPESIKYSGKMLSKDGKLVSY